MKSIVFATKDMFKNYVNWHGRLSRAGYWWGWLGITLITLILNILAEAVSDVFGILVSLWGLATLLPLMFAAMRRYHDSGKPGWLSLLFSIVTSVLGGIALVLLLGSAMTAIFMATGVGTGVFLALLSSAGIFGLIALVLLIVNFVFLVLPSTPGENAYGMPRPFDPTEGEDKGYIEISSDNNTKSTDINNSIDNNNSYNNNNDNNNDNNVNTGSCGN